MSYPKRGPAVSKDSVRDTKTTIKKEQLKNLLVNKFRGKYRTQIGGSDYEATESIIQEQVDAFVNNEIMTESNLLNLDKKLSIILAKPNPSSKR